MKWISVKDELPQDCPTDLLEVIIYEEKDERVYAANYCLGDFYSYNIEGKIYYYKNVSHWMHLPKPPKNKNDRRLHYCPYDQDD